METFILILIVILVLMALVMFVAFIAPKKESDGTYLHIPEGSSLRIVHGEGGAHLNIIYDSIETRPADYELMPDLINDIASPTAQSLDFWGDVADLDSLNPERQKAVMEKLNKMGFKLGDSSFLKAGTEGNDDEITIPSPETEDDSFAIFNIQIL